MRSVRLLSVPGGQALVGALGLEEPGGHTNLSSLRQTDIYQKCLCPGVKDLKGFLTPACSPHPEPSELPACRPSQRNTLGNQPPHPDPPRG